MKKTAIILMLITVLSKVFGFTREITLSYFYGASGISDAYIISLTIPNVIFSFLGTGISTGYIPLYSQIQHKYGLKRANRYTNNLINILMVLYAHHSFVFLLTKPIVKMFALGFKGKRWH